MNPTSLNFVLVGVGGQGTLLASDVLAELGLRLGYDVKKAEVHGMSQRGGSVVSHVRWGEQVFAPVIGRGEADFLIAFEKLEAARFIGMLHPGGAVLVNDYCIEPVTVSAGGSPYPGDESIRAALAQATPRIIWIRGFELAKRLGNERAANAVMLGALSAQLDFDESTWIEALEGRVPARYRQLNREAFIAGRAAAK